MSDVNNLDSYVEDLLALADRGRLNEALIRLVNVTLSFTERESTAGRLFTSKLLDEAALELGRRQVLPGVGKTRRGVVAIVTALYPRGGHSRTLRDLFSVDEDRPAHVLVTNVGHRLTESDLHHILPEDVTVEIASDFGLAGRVRWLQERLADLAPERTYLFQHPFDAVAIAAAQPSLTGKLYFNHHADHGLTLGAHIPGAVHVDPSAKIFHHCRHAEGFTDNVYWPLTGGIEAPPPPWSARSEERRLTTCCSGGIEKFEPLAMVESLPYQVAYQDAVARILRTTGGRHVHVGPLSSDLLGRIEEALLQAGVPVDAFEHRPQVVSLARALGEEGVDLYLGSFPRGGGRANVEAMSIGLPMLLHDNYRSVFLTSLSEAYEGVPSWRTLDDLEAGLRQMTPQALPDHARRSRENYERFHLTASFSKAVRDTFAGSNALTPPPAPPHSPDAMQSFIDERASVGTPFMPTPDLLAALWERNAPKTSVGGVRANKRGLKLDGVFVDHRLHQASLPEEDGLYLHARSGKGAVALVRLAPPTPQDVCGVEATVAVTDPLGEAVEVAVLIPKTARTPLEEIAQAVEAQTFLESGPLYDVVADWAEAREPTEVEAGWADASSKVAIFALRMSPRATSNRHAQVTLTDLAWKAV